MERVRRLRGQEVEAVVGLERVGHCVVQDHEGGVGVPHEEEHRLLGEHAHLHPPHAGGESRGEAPRLRPPADQCGRVVPRGGGGGHLCCLKGVESEVEDALPLGELLMQLGQREAALRRGARRRGRRDAHPLRRLHPVAKVEEVGLN